MTPTDQPAFPLACPDGCVYPGISALAYFMAQEPLTDFEDMSFKGMDALAGYEHPTYTADPLAYLRWEAKARAALKLIRAEAMVAALEGRGK